MVKINLSFRLSLWTYAFLLTVCISNCKKEWFKAEAIPTNPSEAFFKTNKVLDEKTQRLYQALKKMDEKTGFVKKLPVNMGTPIWDKVHFINKAKARTNDEPSGEEALLPMSTSNPSLSGVLGVKEVTADSFQLKPITNTSLQQYCNQPTANNAEIRSYLAAFMHLSYTSFAVTSFHHIPQSIFPEVNFTNFPSNKTILLYQPTTANQRTQSTNSSEPSPDNTVVVIGYVNPHINPVSVTGMILSGFFISNGIITAGTGGNGTSGGASSGIIDGTACGQPWYLPCFADISAGGTDYLLMSGFIASALNLTSAQTDFLNNSANAAFLYQIFNYHKNHNTAQNKTAIVKHINKLMSDAEYRIFTTNHFNSGVGNEITVWWGDDEWLDFIEYNLSEEHFNFYMESNNPPNIKPLEFTSTCDGLKYLAQESNVDAKERSGYFTNDGKFLYAGKGSHYAFPFMFKVKNGQAYYNYSMSLGVPSLSYAGMIIDTIAQEYLIPVSNNIHTHIPLGGLYGVSISTDEAISSGDKTAALNIQGIVPTFKLYVIEVKDNLKYLTSKYNKVNPLYYNIQDDVDFTDICNGIN